ncbi:MAG TPA: 30S ribosomal protein S20 [Pseudobdellovibrionaceae bacterium]|nr:30S ribosomal protein S20 [Pseudobdellovibrionaceae bacterium]
MANHKSAAKRARQSVKRNTVNSRRKSTVKTYEKNLIKALAAKDVKALPELLKNLTSQFMKAANKGALNKATISRKIGRLSTRVQQALSGK